MKRILLTLVLVCGSLGSLQAYTDESAQEKAIEHLLTTKSINVSEVLDICSPNICPDEHFTDECLSQVLTGIDTELQAKGLKVETYLIMINVIDGYTYHIADYYGYWGNSRVITCLNGELRGLQGIADNGVIMVYSSDVKWHKDYFEHKYPTGKIYSYSNRQKVEFK